MDDVEILYQTYLVTFVTAAALLRAGNWPQLAFLIRDVDQRDGIQRFASELALWDARQRSTELRPRAQVLEAVVEKTAEAFHCDPASVYAALEARNR